MAREVGSTARGMQLLIGMAAEHHGLLTRRQMLDAGLTRNFIDGRIKRGLLRSVHAGVYQFGPVCAPRARERAALLACQGGAIGYRSATPLLQLLPEQRPQDLVDVILCSPLHRVRPGIRMHRSILIQDEITIINGILVTTLARTILDIASISTRDLERILGIGERLQPELPSELALLLERYPKRRGTGTLRTLLDDPSSGTFTRSQAEDKLLELVRAAGLPEPQLNEVLYGYEVDCYWPDARLIVEVDGYAYHGSHKAFVQDRRRDSAMIAAGMRVVRLTWRQLTQERDRTLAQLAQALVTRGAKDSAG